MYQTWSNYQFPAVLWQFFKLQTKSTCTSHFLNLYPIVSLFLPPSGWKLFFKNTMCNVVPYFVLYACMLSCFSCVRLFVTPWIVTHQAALSMGFSKQEYWSRLPCPPPGDLPNPGIESMSLMSPALAGGFFTTNTMWEAHFMVWLALNWKNKLSPRCDPGNILTIDLTVYLQQIQEPAPYDLSQSILIKGKGDNLQFWLADRILFIPCDELSCVPPTCSLRIWELGFYLASGGQVSLWACVLQP